MPKTSGAEEIDLSIPLTGHMAKVYLERVNMLASIREVRRDERMRSKAKLKAVVRQLGLQKQMEQEIPGKVAEADEQAMERKRRRLAELHALLGAEEEASGASRPPPGRSRSYVDIPDLSSTSDPDRVRRLEHLDRKIESREGGLRRIQSEAELRTAKLRAQTVFEPEKPHEFLWDHLPQNAMLSEKEKAFFPRSLKALREIGTGKDPRFVREMDENYKYREAMLMMAKAKGKD